MKTNLLLLSVFFAIIIYANINHWHGITGMTLRDSGIGCFCHNEHPNDSVKVWIEGPDTVYLNDTAYYKIFISGGPAVTGGFNLASYSGILDTTDPLTQILYDELTHSMPKQFVNDTVFWDFIYIAPDSLIVDTLYSAGNSTNNDTIPVYFDKWNHAENLAVHIVEEPVYVANKNLPLENFILFQNYPNPFNPSTKIRFAIPSNVKSEMLNVSLKVYDVLGNEVATLVNEELHTGEYEVHFDASSNSSFRLTRDLTSGIYLYQLKTGNLIQTKKMLLLK